MEDTGDHLMAFFGTYQHRMVCTEYTLKTTIKQLF